MYTDTQEKICELVGANSIKEVRQEFAGMDHSEIEHTLNYMFPLDDNSELAAWIVDEINDGRRPGPCGKLPCCDCTAECPAMGQASDRVNI